VLESVEVLSHDVALRVMAYRHNQFQLQQHWMQMMMTQQQQQQHQQRPMRMIQQHPGGGGGLGWVPNIVDLSIARMQQYQYPPPSASALHSAAAAAYNLGLQYYRQYQHNMAAYYQSSRVVPHHDNPVVSNAACLSPSRNHGITEAAKLKAPIDDDDNVPKMAMYKSNTKMEQRAIIKKAEKKRTYCRGPYRKRKPKLVHRLATSFIFPSYPSQKRPLRGRHNPQKHTQTEGKMRQMARVGTMTAPAPFHGHHGAPYPAPSGKSVEQ
jgi:hypothetical protein